ncbi:hypothetical protein [Anaerovorax sp. IOR16]|uniref:hypothetical protein n=1 Tax=Anaerovorax sp. IOR16 TaxID=2773458 RepID=UPI0019D0876D|nr:hypothetical protein [Anaerovorax sp. IOR16]
MTAKAKRNDSYNINYMRKAFVLAREKGNKGLISKKMISELEIDEVWFKVYLSNIEKLYKATCNYITVKHNPLTLENEKLVAREPLYPLWKELLSSGEKDKTSKDMRCSETDIDSIVGYSEMFMDDSVNIDDDKDFVAFKEIAHTKLSRFRKDIETLLGIKICNAEVMDDSQRDFLTSQRKIISGRKKAESKIESVKVQIATLKTLNQSDDVLAKIAEFEKIIESCNETIKLSNQSLKELIEKHEKALTEQNTKQEQKVA